MRVGQKVEQWTKQDTNDARPDARPDARHDARPDARPDAIVVEVIAYHLEQQFPLLDRLLIGGIHREQAVQVLHCGLVPEVTEINNTA